LLRKGSHGDNNDYLHGQGGDTVLIENFQDLPVVLTVPEMAKVLRISRSKAYSLSKETGFPTIKIGRCIRVSKHELLQWLGKHFEANNDTM